MAILVNTGKQLLVDRLRGTATNAPSWIHWGTGTTAENVSQTALITPASEARVNGTMSSPSANVFRVVGTLTADGSKTISEAGVFDANSAGTMLIRALFTGIPLLAGDQIQLTFDLTVS